MAHIHFIMLLHHTGKDQFQKLSNYHNENFREIFAALSIQRTEIHHHVTELKSYLCDNDEDAKDQSSIRIASNQFDTVLKEFKRTSQDINDFVSRFQEDKIYVNSVKSLTEANKLSSEEVHRA